MARNKLLIYQVIGSDFRKSGGQEKYVLELAEYLVNREYRVKLLCRMGRMYTDQTFRVNLTNANTPRYSSNLFIMLQHLPNPLTVFLGVAKLMKEFKQETSYEKVIHVHDLSSSLLIGLIITKIFKSPLLVQIHGFPLREPSIKLKRSRSLMAFFIMLLTKIWHILIVKIIQINSNLVLVNNSEVKRFYETLGITGDNLEVVPSAINLHKHTESLLSAEDALACLGLSKLKKELLIGFIGRLSPEKNLERLIEAFSESVKSLSVMKVKLVIIGEGYMRPVLEKAVNEHKINQYAFFLGSIQDAYKTLNAIDIFVLPSLSEGSPFSLIEAMAAGKAIIASDISGIRELVSNGKEAILINPDNIEELKQAILLLYSNPELRTMIGRGAKEKAKLFDVAQVYAQVQKAYEEAIRRKTKSIQ